MLLSGHILLATGNIKEAVALYRQAMNAQDSTVKTISQLRKRLDDDWAIYPSDTLDRNIIPLITDATTLD